MVFFIKDYNRFLMVHVTAHISTPCSETKVLSRQLVNLNLES